MSKLGTQEVWTALADILDDPRRSSWATFPEGITVMMDGREVPWGTCDAALAFALGGRKVGAVLSDAWLSSLPAAIRYEEAALQRFLRNSEPQARPQTPSPPDAWEAGALARLGDAVLLLRTPVLSSES